MDFEKFQQGCKKIALISSVSNNDQQFFTFKYVILDSLLQKKENGEYLEIEVIQNPQRYIFHLLYSETFKIPVIYFNIYDIQENAPKTSEEILSKYILEIFSKTSINSLPFIVQEYHPTLGYPAFTFHNCYMKDFLSNLSFSKESDSFLILSLLSIYLRVFNINVPLKIAQFLLSN